MALDEEIGGEAKDENQLLRVVLGTARNVNGRRPLTILGGGKKKGTLTTEYGGSRKPGSNWKASNVKPS